MTTASWGVPYGQLKRRKNLEPGLQMGLCAIQPYSGVPLQDSSSARGCSDTELEGSRALEKAPGRTQKEAECPIEKGTARWAGSELRCVYLRLNSRWPRALKASAPAPVS